MDVPCSGGINGYGHGSICEAVKPLGKKCQGNGLLQKIDTLTSSTEEKNQEESAHKDQLESKIDSILSKVEGLMAKSGVIENRFNEIDNIHLEIKGNMQWWNINKISTEQEANLKVVFNLIFTDEQSSLDEKVENISATIKELNSILSSKEENEFQNATELS